MSRFQKTLIAAIAALSVSMIAASAWYGISFEEPFTPMPVHAAAMDIEPPTDLREPSAASFSVPEKAFDPLKVQNSDVILDQLAKRIASTRHNWKLEWIEQGDDGEWLAKLRTKDGVYILRKGDAIPGSDFVLADITGETITITDTSVGCTITLRWSRR